MATRTLDSASDGLNLSRRALLRASVAVGGGLALQAILPGVANAASEGAAASAGAPQ